MSWEEARRQKSPCPCGRGFILKITTENDWFQTDETSDLECTFCEAKNAAIAKAGRPYRERAAALQARARSEAEKRFLPSFLGRLDGKNKKQIWAEIFSKNSYPSLGTFYQHVSSSGLENYLRSYFQSKFEHSFPNEYRDEAIDALLREATENIAQAEKAEGAVE